jgi:hypothetical protein
MSKAKGGGKPASVDLILKQGDMIATATVKNMTPRKSSKQWEDKLYTDPAIVEAITQMLLDNNDKLFRPPRQAAKLLAYIVGLYHKSEPFPSRAEVAEKLEISIPTIDSAISSRIAEGYLSIEIDTIEGNINRRPSSIRRRYYIPSNEVLETVEEARPQVKSRKP